MYWRFPLAVVLYVVLSQVVHSLGAFIGMKYYVMPEYFSIWSKLMVDQVGPPPSSFYLYSLLFSLICGSLVAWVYFLIADSLRGRTRLLKGLFFGLLIILVSQVPGTLMLILILNVPVFLIVSWFIEGSVIALCAGIVFTFLLKKEGFFSRLFNR